MAKINGMKFISGLALCVGIACLAIGFTRKLEAYLPTKPPPPPAMFGDPAMGPEFGGVFVPPAPPAPPEKVLISESLLVEAATFSGAVLAGENLCLKFNPSEPRDKQACPT